MESVSQSMSGKLKSPQIQNVAVGYDCIWLAMVSLTYVAMAMICGGWLQGMLILHADISLLIWLSFATGMSSATISSLCAIRVIR